MTGMTFRELFISIHAPREGRDADAGGGGCVAVVISIHAPREGRDDRLFDIDNPDEIFQSTRPARGATVVFWFTALVM